MKKPLRWSWSQTYKQYNLSIITWHNLLTAERKIFFQWLFIVEFVKKARMRRKSKNLRCKMWWSKQFFKGVSSWTAEKYLIFKMCQIERIVTQSILHKSSGKESLLIYLSLKISHMFLLLKIKKQNRSTKIWCFPHWLIQYELLWTQLWMPTILLQNEQQMRKLEKNGLKFHNVLVKY